MVPLRVVAGVQARLSSSRLPRKVLADLAGRALVLRVVDRVRLARGVDEVFVLTSSDPSDDPLVDVLDAAGVEVRRGPLQDVLARYLALSDECDPDIVVRVTADCPLVDPVHISRQVEALLEFDADLVRPSRAAHLIEGVLGGSSAFSVRALRHAVASTDPRDREHVGSFFFRRSRELRWAELEVHRRFERPDIRLCVDEPEDLDLQRRLWEAIGAGGSPTLDQAIAWLDEHPRVRSLNSRVVDSADTRAARQVRCELPLPVGTLSLSHEAAAR